MKAGIRGFTFVLLWLCIRRRAEGWVSASFNSVSSLRSVTFHYLFTFFVFTTIRQTMRVLTSPWGLPPPVLPRHKPSFCPSSRRDAPYLYFRQRGPLSLSGSEQISVSRYQAHSALLPLPASLPPRPRLYPSLSPFMDSTGDLLVLGVVFSFFMYL